MDKKNYVKVATTKEEMSQEFDKDGKVFPFTGLKVEAKDAAIFENIKSGTKLILVGTSKGKGFAGVIKKWGFRAGPRTHGQDKHRSAGSIGTQGQGRVIPGKKMAGRMGGKKITLKTKALGFDKSTNLLKVKGAVPGHRNALLTVYIEKTDKNEKEN